MIFRTNVQLKTVKSVIPKGIGKFLIFIFVSIAANYFSPIIIIKDLWFLLLIYLYTQSTDEPFWLALMLVLNDGFMSFFGVRGVLLESFGIPDFEISHFYLLAVMYKVAQKPKKAYVFYDNWLRILLGLIIILVIWGFSQGIPDDYSIGLRTLRVIYPLLLFYYIPKILTEPADYERLFSFVFIIALLGFVTQVFSVLVGAGPRVIFGISEGRIMDDLTVRAWRGFYNSSSSLIAFMAAMFYLVSSRKVFPKLYLQVIMIAIYVSILLSATRGWIVGFGISAVLFFLFIQKVDIKQIAAFFIIAFIALQVLMLHPRMQIQISNAIERTLTLEALIEGDLTAGGTASRADIQGPAVMVIWEQSPFIGWGFSDVYYKNYNVHVGNQTILLHSGIIGALLLLGFFAFFFFKLYYLSMNIRKKHPYSLSLLVFPVFFLGWFFIHSTSGQHFGYTTSYINALPQSIFLGFGATIYRQIILDRQSKVEKQR